MEKEAFYTGEGILAGIEKLETINVDFTFEDFKKYILDNFTTWKWSPPRIDYDYRNKKS